jgi:creatinine amidohydrolase
MDSYYTAHDDLDANPFNWIQCHPLMDAEIIAQYPFDHAGAGETSLMLALCPDEVDMGLFSQEKWYVRSAAEASRELGEKGVAMILARLRRLLA